MEWLANYHLYLFDFDGILVNTEKLHYNAYQLVCEKRGFHLPWSFKTYLQAAFYSATGVRDAIYKTFPDLHTMEPNWDIIYAEKKKVYADLLIEKGVELMPGVARLLTALEKQGKKRCVVTHSPIEHIQMIRQQHPLLNSIPHWITREDYEEPKPASECYLKAIKTLGDQGDQVIGFEDSPRGLTALLGTPAHAVFVSSVMEPSEVGIDKPFEHITSFDELS